MARHASPFPSLPGGASSPRPNQAGEPTEDAILAITTNEPSQDDPLHVYHLKMLAAKSVHSRLKSRISYSSKDSRKSNQGSFPTVNSPDQDSISPPSISSRTTHSMGSNTSCSALAEERPWLYRDTTFVHITNLTVVPFAFFWTIQALFMEEIMLHCEVDLRSMGYLCSVVRLGKITGHLVTIPLTTLLPNKIVHMLISCMLIFGGVLAAVPHVTDPRAMGTIFFFVGLSYGIVDSCIVVTIQMLEDNKKGFFTNLVYAEYSCATFGTSVFTKFIKIHVGSIKDQLIWATALTSSVSVFIAFIILIIHLMRETKEYCLVNEEEVEQLPTKFKGFKHYSISFILLVLAAFTTIFSTSAFWNFTLLFAKAAAAGIDEHQAFFVVQVFMAALMVIRIFAVPVVYFYSNQNVILAACNAVLVVAAIASVLLQDKVYEGLLLVMMLYGLGLGWFHQSLLNWLQAHIVITPRTGLPFFLASVSGVVTAPTLLPHLVADETGAVMPVKFIWLTFCLTLVTVFASTLLMVIERIKIDKVQDIHLVPSFINSSPNGSRCQGTPSVAKKSRGTPSAAKESRDEPSRALESLLAGSSLSKLSNFSQRLDPTLSFMSSMQ